MSLVAHPELRLALAAPSPYDRLRALVEEELSKGVEREHLLRDLESLRQEAEREEVEDAVLDVMDDLSGWTSPKRRL